MKKINWEYDWEEDDDEQGCEHDFKKVINGQFNLMCKNCGMLAISSYDIMDTGEYVDFLIDANNNVMYTNGKYN